MPRSELEFMEESRPEGERQGVNHGPTVDQGLHVDRAVGLEPWASLASVPAEPRFLPCKDDTSRLTHVGDFAGSTAGKGFPQ